MQSDHIRCRKNSIIIHIFRDLHSGLRGPTSGGEHLHAHGLCDTPGGLADPAKPDYTHCFSRKLNKGIIPVAPVLIIFPFSRMDAVGMALNMVADLKEHRDRKLTDGRGAVGRYI